jgi:hypothetical protein
VGLVPALTFYMAKGDENAYEFIYKALARRCTATNQKPDMKICEEFEDKEGAGYSALLAVATNMLAERGFIDGNKAAGYKGLAEELKAISGKAQELAARRILVEYLTEFKKLAEAFFGD